MPDFDTLGVCFGFLAFVRSLDFLLFISNLVLLRFMWFTKQFPA